MPGLHAVRLAALTLVAVAGCGRAPVTAPAGTGAREVAQRYYESLALADWAGAYALLHPDARSRYTPEEFARLAQRHLPVAPGRELSVHVWSCEEQGDQAIAHVRLAPGGGPGPHRDGVTLVRVDGEWRVVLPRQFGRAPAR